MTFGNKLSKLRREQGHTQEQLASLLGVSRQSVSKWESDLAFPETEKLLRIGQIYGCSMDYLLTDRAEAAPAAQAAQPNFGFYTFERKSEKMVGGLPLWHINIGPGRTAKGVFALGLVARGVVTAGLVSTGVISFGLLSLGLLAVGTLALGLLSVGAIAAGIFALGAIAVGIVTMGALSMGCFSLGALARARYMAVGDNARAWIAIGEEAAEGYLFQHRGRYWDLGLSVRQTIDEILQRNVPLALHWAAKVFLWFL